MFDRVRVAPEMGDKGLNPEVIDKKDTSQCDTLRIHTDTSDDAAAADSLPSYSRSQDESIGPPPTYSTTL